MESEKPKPEEQEVPEAPKENDTKVEEPQIEVEVVEEKPTDEKKTPAVDNGKKEEKKTNPFRPDEDNRSTIMF
jgi:hypothetical protein